MNIEIRGDIAVIRDNELRLDDARSALDVVMSVNYETGCRSMVFSKELVNEEFFRLSSGLAGEILQKFINYHIRIAIYGDYSCYTSKPLKDFIYESNKGNDVYFVPTLEEAIAKLNG